MNLEMDAVTKEYAQRSLASLVDGPDRLFDVDPADYGLQEQCLVSVLLSGVRMGALSYENVRNEGVHRFLCTEKLVRHWGWLFPNATLTASPQTSYQIKLTKAGRKLLRGDWKVGRGETPPPWPDEGFVQNG